MTMPKRKQDRGTPKPKWVPVPRSSFVLLTATASAAIVLSLLYLLRAREITLGQGALYYRFSSLDGVRAILATPAFFLAFLAIIALFLLAQTGARRAIGFGVALLLMVFSGVWIWWAPPSAVMQHTFNMRSPSQEGAFYIETMHLPSLADYLRTFDRHIQHSPEDMLGTRVLSNPPGMTILAVAVEHFIPAKTNPPGVLERYLLSIDTPEFDLVEAADTMHLSMVLTALWALSAIAAYGAGRLLLPAPGAFAFAVIATFTPSAVHFTPGKDAAQLLTINLMMWTWLAASKRNSSLLSVVSGVFLAIGGVSGLIHFWVAFALVVATAWETGTVRTFIRLAVPAFAGVLLFILVIDIAIGWNIARTWLAVLIRFGQIQQTFAINRTIWFFIGLPLFALFLAPGQITFALLAARSRRLNFGMKLALATVVAMLLTYITGVTYELPRLWVVFLPPLTLGLMLATPLPRARHRKALTALALIVSVQIIATAWHWSLLDVRESEYRLREHRFFN